MRTNPFRNCLLSAFLLLLLILPACDDDNQADIEDGDAVEHGDGDLDGDLDDSETDALDEQGETGEQETIEAEEASETDGDGDDSGEAEQDEVEEDLEKPEGYPDSLPIDFSRPQEGEEITDEEIAEFTARITGMLKDSGYFDWVWWTSHGLDDSFDPDMPDYKLYWQDTNSYKEGDSIRFEHYGGADNIMIRTPKILNQAISGYMLSGDSMFARIVEQYCKGIVAQSLGMEWGNEDPTVKYIQARAIFTRDHEYVMEGDRRVVVEYELAKKEKEDWNAHTIPNPQNPYWGDIWVRNMRSKDDVPHMFRSVPMLIRLAEEAPDENIKQAAAEALEYLEGFAKDIVDSGYNIRTKDRDGNAIIPTNENGTINDLASFVLYEEFMPNAECNAKLASSLIAYGEELENDCEAGFGGGYEAIATVQHYFNNAIIRYFHISALANAMMKHETQIAMELMAGLAERADLVMNDDEGREDHHEWDADATSFLLAASASAGLPLTNREARHIQQWYGMSADHYRRFPYWDPWDDTLPDGKFDYKPNRQGPVDPEDPESENLTFVRPEEIAFILEYCYSPFRNPAGARLVDCDIVADPSRWGESPDTKKRNR